MHYPPPPRRPLAYRVKRARLRHGEPAHGRTWYFCVAALALLAFGVTIATSRSAVAAPLQPGVIPFTEAPGSQPGTMRHLPIDTPPASLRPPLDAPDASADEPSSMLGGPRQIDGAPVPAAAHRTGAAPAMAVPTDLAAPSPDTAAQAAAGGGLGAKPNAAGVTAGGAADPRLMRPAAVVGRLGASRQGRQLRAQVTAYSASEEEGTAWGITRTGTRARPGVVAVDPRVIPLGSRLRIAGLPGIYRAEDTGGGILGAHLDVFMDSRADALRFGRQTSVLVEVLD